MKVRELITQLLNEDMDSECYVRVEDENSDFHFLTIDGLHILNDCYNDNVTLSVAEWLGNSTKGNSRY